MKTIIIFYLLWHVLCHLASDSHTQMGSWWMLLKQRCKLGLSFSGSEARSMSVENDSSSYKLFLQALSVSPFLVLCQFPTSPFLCFILLNNRITLCLKMPCLFVFACVFPASCDVLICVCVCMCTCMCVEVGGNDNMKQKK